ncbi:hypothetical protein DBR40_09870 [Pedobacter sp. KBW01]|nr:hypothetical protein DBR40_09870 [Pedobacter sp. KBW01]
MEMGIIARLRTSDYPEYSPKSRVKIYKNLTEQIILLTELNFQGLLFLPPATSKGNVQCAMTR